MIFIVVSQDECLIVIIFGIQVSYGRNLILCFSICYSYCFIFKIYLYKFFSFDQVYIFLLLTPCVYHNIFHTYLIILEMYQQCSVFHLLFLVLKMYYSLIELIISNYDFYHESLYIFCSVPFPSATFKCHIIYKSLIII